MESSEPISEAPYSQRFGPVSFPRLIGKAGEFLAYAEPRQERIDKALDDYLAHDGRRPAILFDAMRYSVLTGGKRLRPLLCGVAAEVCGRSLDDVLPTACAFELIHAFSLIHDDLPAIDNDRLRRGRPTCHVLFGEAHAILAGDALLARAYELLALQRKTAPAHLVLDVVELVSQAIGWEGMAAGEVEDILAEGKEGDMETLELIHRHKAGDLIRASLLAGAILGGGADEVRERLARYGANIGLAFQIVDDVLGVTGDPRLVGKTIGIDDEKRKLTYPRLLGLKKSREIAAAKAQEALYAIEGLGPASEPLRSLGLYVLHRNM
jgi:geranylgeranyl diphosphate synthase type II